MSEADAELQALADSGYGALNAGDLEGFLALVAEDVEFTSMVAEAEGATFWGHAGVREWWGSVRGAFDRAPHWEVLELRGAGDVGIVKFRMTGTLAGVEVAQTMWQVVRRREGKLTWWAFFRTEQEALEAARATG
jgi:ketosteroid isomerase-like protein